VQSINFFCKRCAAAGRHPVPTLITNSSDQQTAEAIAEARGWRLTGDGWYCPECVAWRQVAHTHEPKHTPGPWIVDTIQNVGRNWLIADCGSERADNQHYIVTTDHVHASEIIHGGALNDACLIAAAPDLLAALKAMLDDWEDQAGPAGACECDSSVGLTCNACHARAAIAKAEGAHRE
jgi:hypothetical protein